jgi:hypothetical protein
MFSEPAMIALDAGRTAATWKIWGNSQGALDERADPENLPDGLIKQKWPSDTFAVFDNGDWGRAYHEREELRSEARSRRVQSGSCSAPGIFGRGSPSLPRRPYRVALEAGRAAVAAPARHRG